LLLDEVVGEEHLSMAPSAGGAPARGGEDLMPWEFAEPPALAGGPEPGQVQPEPGDGQVVGEASGRDASLGEVEAEDEDLEMFRSWLQSLKK
jgi:hypothetical protein